MGEEQAESIRFIDDFDALIACFVSYIWNFSSFFSLRIFSLQIIIIKFPIVLIKIRVEGTFPEVQEVFDMKRSLETVKAILGFFKTKEAVKYPVLRRSVQFSKNVSLCS